LSKGFPIPDLTEERARTLPKLKPGQFAEKARQSPFANRRGTAMDDLKATKNKEEISEDDGKAARD